MCVSYLVEEFHVLKLSYGGVSYKSNSINCIIYCSVYLVIVICY